MRAAGLAVDFAPLADVYQGGGIDQSRTFGTTSQDAITYAGAFLDGLQQNGVAGTLKHWPGIGAASGNKCIHTTNCYQRYSHYIANPDAGSPALCTFMYNVIQPVVTLFQGVFPNVEPQGVSLK
jgi:beta-glucosidase-like glycosyl hydrolase